MVYIIEFGIMGLRVINKSILPPILLYVFLFLFFLLFWFFVEPEPKLIIVSVYAFISIGLTIWKKNFLISALSGFFLFLPFNITFLLPIDKSQAFASGIYVNYLAPVLTITDITVIFLLFSLLLHSRRAVKDKTFLIILLSMALYVVYHYVLNPDINVLVQTVRVVVYLSAVLLVIDDFQQIFSNIFTHKKQFILISLLSVIIQLSVSIFQIQRGNFVGLSALGESMVTTSFVDASTLVIDGNIFLRAYGTFPHPNVLAGYSFLISLIFFRVILFEKFNLLNYFVFVLSSFTVLITFSQSAFIFYLFGILILCFFRYRKPKRLYKNFLSRERFPAIFLFVELLLPEKRSVDERISLFSASVGYLKENFLLGVGNGNFTRSFYEFAPLGASGMTIMQPVHNIFMLFLIENGVILSIIILAITLLAIYKKFKRCEWDELSILSIFFIFVIGSVDHYLLSLPQGLAIFSILLVLLFRRTDKQITKV